MFARSEFVSIILKTRAPAFMNGDKRLRREEETQSVRVGMKFWQ